MTIKPGDRIHCDTWLAHRPEGWVVEETCSDVTLEVVFTDVAFAWVPIPDCELVPRPFKVGDWVRHANFTTGIVFAVNDGMGIWVGYTTGQSTFYGNTAQDGLTHIDPPEQSHA